MDGPQLAAYAEQLRSYRKEAGMTIRDQTSDGWTVVLRRRPARIVDGRAEGPLHRRVRDHLLQLR